MTVRRFGSIAAAILAMVSRPLAAAATSVPPDGGPAGEGTGTPAPAAPAATMTPAFDGKQTLPMYPGPGTHVAVGLSFPGSCIRNDPNVGKSSICEEAFGGVDIIFPRHVHLDAELGVGYSGIGSAGDPNLGIAYGSGGTYAVVRAMLGADLSPVFFWRAGAQARFMYSLHWVDPGMQAVGDLGTRVYEHFEVGMRGFAGFDGVVAAGNGEGNSWAWAPAYGLSVFGRFLLP